LRRAAVGIVAVAILALPAIAIASKQKLVDYRRSQR
jgi:hypothetical protein